MIQKKKLNLIIIGILVASISTLAAILKPHSTEDYVAAYKNKIDLQFTDSLYTEDIQTTGNSGNSDLKGTIEAVKISDEQTEILGCFDLPDNGAWDPDSTITINDERIDWAEFRLLNPKDPKTYESSCRCYLITFPYAKTDQKNIELKIETGLTKEVNHGLVNKETENVIKEKLQKIYPDLDFTIVAQSEKQGSGAYIEFTSKPKGMSDEDALGLINNAMTERYSGTWTFDINIP